MFSERQNLSLLKIPFKYTGKDGRQVLVNLEACPNVFITDDDNARRAENLVHIEESLLQLHEQPFELVIPHPSREHIRRGCPTLVELSEELNMRYAEMSAKDIRNIEGLRRDKGNVCTYVIIVDELEELTPDEFDALDLIARKGRAAGFHIILSTSNSKTKLPQRLKGVFHILD